MKKNDWVERSPIAVTVCDKKGIIISMNEAAGKVFKNYGGKKLIGQSVLKCHPAKARTKLKKMLKGGRSNIYTIEKKGKKKLIYQAPWFNRTGRYSGIIELSLPLPSKLPNFVRKA